MSSSNQTRLTETQLRQLYDDEEIERFLRYFSTYVKEVRAPETPTSSSPPDVNAALEDERVSIVEQSSTVENDNVLHEPELSVSEEIAQNYVAPYLSSSRPAPPEFTFNDFRLAMQRLYLVIPSTYIPFFVHLYRLAKWENRRVSSSYCVLFWLLWRHDLLPAAVLSRILASLIARKLRPYPRFSELERHRAEISLADEFGERLSKDLDVSSSLGIRDIWKFCRPFIMPRRNKGKESQKPRRRSSTSIDPEDLEKNDKEIQELKRLGLFLVNEVADLHERVRNIFLWRKHSSSYFYSMILALMCLVTLIVPSGYLLKFVLGIFGFLYWHVTPVVTSLSVEDRLRLPPLFVDVPTDAEYAMELISRRVTAGLEIRPSKPSERSRARRSESTTNEQDCDSEHNREPSPAMTTKDASTRWKDITNVVESSKTLLRDGKRILSNPQSDDGATSSSFSDKVNRLKRRLGEQSDPVYTYPAQHSSSPGILTLTPSTIYFTPLASPSPKFTIPLQSIKGVRKAGVLKGLDVHWTETQPSGSSSDFREKFLWVGGRDELFARLVAVNGRGRWIRT